MKSCLLLFAKPDCYWWNTENEICNQILCWCGLCYTLNAIAKDAEEENGNQTANIPLTQPPNDGQ